MRDFSKAIFISFGTAIFGISFSGLGNSPVFGCFEWAPLRGKTETNGFLPTGFRNDLLA